MSRYIPAFCLAVFMLVAPAPAAAQLNFGNCQATSYITLSLAVADPARGKDATRREARGQEGVPIEVRCGTDVQLIALEIDMLMPEERLLVRGNVVFQQGGTRIAAARGEFDTKTKTGFFEDASGTLQLTDRQINKTLFGTQEPEAFFSADRIEKTGDRSYRLTNATFTPCVQPSRRWQMRASTLTFTVDRHAILYNAVMQIKDVPLLYLPIFYYPIHEDGRATGFLMPNYGSSTYRGTSLGNAFFWAINRSMDATVYHDWFTRTGHGFGADFRYVAGPESSGDADVQIIREKALLSATGTVTTPARQSFKVHGRMAQSLPGRIRLLARADYFSDVTSQQLYQVDLAAFSQRTRSFGADLSGSWGRLRAVAQAERNDVFYGRTTASSQRYLPRASLSISESPILGTKITAGASFDTLNVVWFTDVDRPETRRSFFRTDSTATVRAPVPLGPALTFNGSASIRHTTWDQSKDPVTGALRNTPMSRQLLTLNGSLKGPVFSRVFNTPGNGFAERFKHLIEPVVSITKHSAFTRFNEVVQFDGVDTVVGGTTSIAYGITNRVLARVRQGDAPAQVREIMSFEVNQTYYSNALAASYDQQYQSSFNGLNVLAPESKFSAVRGALRIHPAPAVTSEFDVEYNTQFMTPLSFRASVRATQPAFDVSGSWSKRRVIPGLRGFDDPASANHSVNFTARAKQPRSGSTLMYEMSYDLFRDRMLQQRVVGLYNAQCCGVAVDYTVTNLTHLGLRHDKRFSLSFSLAGIGSFSNLLGVFGDNGRQR